MGEPRFQYCEVLPEGEIIVGDIKDEVPEELVCTYFGPKSSKSGWKYNARTTPDEQAAILSLYQQVYDVDEMPNKEITLQFARGLILMSLDKSVNWSQFNRERREYRTGLKLKKSLNAKERLEKEGVGGAPIAANLVKRRCVAPGAFPTSLKLTVKAESGEGRFLMGKKGPTVGKKSAYVSPFWLADEIDEMGKTITKRSVLVQLCRDSLLGVSCERVVLEDKLRRARMLLTDRQVLIFEAQENLAHLHVEELAIRASLEKGGALFPDVEGVEALKAQLDTVLFKKSCQEQMSRLSNEVIVDCEATISILERELEAGSCQEKDLDHKVICLEGMMEKMNEQLLAMKEGEGATFWPRPLPKSPELPLTITHTLNACPVCCMWYSCFDYVPISCGHCSHPWCLYEHAQMSNSCKVGGCNMELRGQHGIALGLRPQTMNTANSKSSRELPSSSKLAARLATATPSVQDTTTTPVSSWNNDAPGKQAPLSQESQTNKTLDQLPANSIGQPSMPTICYVCDKKPASIILQKCGHAFFCFGCIQLKKECPFCFESISGWSPLPSSSTTNSLLSSRGRVQDIVSGAIVACGSKKRKAADPSTTLSSTLSLEVEPSVLPPSSCPTENIQPLDDNDDDAEAGNIYWCSDQDFKAGGRGSFVKESLDKHPTVVSEVERNDLDNGNNHNEETPLQAAPAVIQGRKEDVRVFTGSKISSEGIETMNSTRVVHKALNELISPVLVKNNFDKNPGAFTISTPTLGIPRGRGCRPATTTKASRSIALKKQAGGRSGKGRVNSVPAKFKDL